MTWTSSSAATRLRLRAFYACVAGARAEELAQEAFLVTIRRGMTREPKARAQAFLRQTARHLWLRERRDGKRRAAKQAQLAEHLYATGCARPASRSCPSQPTYGAGLPDRAWQGPRRFPRPDAAIERLTPAPCASSTAIDIVLTANDRQPGTSPPENRHPHIAWRCPTRVDSWRPPPQPYLSPS